MKSRGNLSPTSHGLEKYTGAFWMENNGGGHHLIVITLLLNNNKQTALIYLIL